MTRKKLMDLIIVCGILLLIALATEQARAATYGPYDMDNAWAVDGDTIRGNIYVFPGFISTFSVRLAGIDTPELRGNGSRPIPECEKVLARSAILFVNDWLARNEPLRISQIKTDKFNLRIDALVTGKTGQTLNAALLAAGHARASAANQPRAAWCQ